MGQQESDPRKGIYIDKSTPYDNAPKSLLYCGTVLNPRCPATCDFTPANPGVESIRSIYHRGERIIALTVHGEVISIKHKKRRRLLQSRRIVQLECGGAHCLALDDLGRVYAWGNSNDFGQIGDGRNPFKKPRLITKIKDKILDIYTGWRSSFALTERGVVWAWGNNGYGQLALNFCTAVLAPKRIEVLEELELIKLSCGAYHTMALTKYGTVFVWGKTPLKNTCEPEEILFGHEGALDIYSAANCCLVCTKSRKLYIWGTLYYDISFDLPTMVSLFEGMNVRTVWTDCWAESVMIKDMDGSVFVWGRNVDGQLGLGHKNNAKEPISVMSLCKRNITHASFGDTSTFVVVAIEFQPYEMLSKTSKYFDLIINTSLSA